MKKIYIGCALTIASKEFILEVEKLKKELSKKFTVLEFIPVDQKTPKEVYENDINHIKNCDLFLAICDYPSTGLGYELGVAIEIKKKTLAVAHCDSKISRMVLGIPADFYEFKRYNNLLDVINFID